MFFRNAATVTDAVPQTAREFEFVLVPQILRSIGKLIDERVRDGFSSRLQRNDISATITVAMHPDLAHFVGSIREEIESMIALAASTHAAYREIAAEYRVRVVIGDSTAGPVFEVSMHHLAHGVSSGRNKADLTPALGGLRRQVTSLERSNKLDDDATAISTADTFTTAAHGSFVLEIRESSSQKVTAFRLVGDRVVIGRRGAGSAADIQVATSRDVSRLQIVLIRDPTHDGAFAVWNIGRATCRLDDKVLVGAALASVPTADSGIASESIGRLFEERTISVGREEPVTLRLLRENRSIQESTLAN